ncbi:MAG: DUF488 domain-containing protein [Thermodesulfovibrionales bacterium]
MSGQEATQTIYTLGTGLRSRKEFVEILLSHGIEVMVDVRCMPCSKLPNFSRQGIEEIACSNGLGYVFLSRELGGLRTGGYTAYMATDAFAEAVDRLEEIGRNSITAFICAERLPWKCHRKWISLELKRRGWPVRHIIDKDHAWEPQ